MSVRHRSSLQRAAALLLALLPVEVVALIVAQRYGVGPANEALLVELSAITAVALLYALVALARPQGMTANRSDAVRERRQLPRLLGGPDPWRAFERDFWAYAESCEQRARRDVPGS